MNYIVDAKQMREIDRRTIEEIGIPALVLMERAAQAVAAQAEKMAEEFGGRKAARILAVCGSGGNGGDAAAAARILHLRGYSVEILAAFRGWNDVPDGKEDTAGQSSCGESTAQRPAGGEETAQQPACGEGTAQQSTSRENTVQRPACGESTARQLAIAAKCGVPECARTGKGIDFSSYHILLDGIFGVGLSREITGEYRELIEKMNGSGAKILAVDIPSGIDGSSGRCMGVCVNAECTVTFGEKKLGQLVYPGAGACGELILADIGFPPFLTAEVEKMSDCSYLTYTEEDICRLPARHAHSHKGSYGRVLIFAGSEEMTGAAYLAAAAAYRCGTGLVKLVSAPGCVDTVRRMLPEALMQELPETLVQEQTEALCSFWKEQVDWADAVLAGPGIGTGEAARRALSALLDVAGDRKKPLVLDADALNLLAAELGDAAGSGAAETEQRLSRLSRLLPEGTVLTPHPKELSRLIGQPVSQICEHFVDTAKQCLYNNKLIYVLKDARTIVAGEGTLYVNTSGCDGMATGGSGDVLAGIIAGFLTGMEPAPAARLGVYLHGLAGECAARERGRRGMLAGDIVEALRW
ncbi:MAG: NAD(P)H-hydrate dehydratase [Lachnospiraceae bacterium]|nr:NAD(P)H-hydrate dehydratase [Lachnospiraceae bacterium]